MQLFSFRATGDAAAVALDTVAGHVVTEAAWSADGTHIAWVARVGAERQLDVFVSLADGSDVRNVSENPADDYHIAWSPDGELLAFTSNRDGNAELYAVELSDKRLWRLTYDQAQDDRATFSPDGRSVAFESSRGGSFGVLVMPALGGEARPVASAARLELIGWRGSRRPFVDHVRVSSANVGVGSVTSVELHALDETGDGVRVHGIEWKVLDSAFIAFADARDSNASTRRVRGVRQGLARVAATLGRWRSDTAFVRVGSDSIRMIDESFNDLSKWRALGRGARRLKGDERGLLLSGQRDWETGLLSRTILPLSPGLEVRVTIDAPWDATPDIASEASVSLIVPEDETSLDSVAPQFLKLVSVSWKADAGRLVYGVGKEVFSEAVGMTPARSRQIRIFVEEDTTVAFSLDGVPRWRSTLRVVNPRTGSRAQVWIAARAIEDQVRIKFFSAKLTTKDAESR